MAYYDKYITETSADGITTLAFKRLNGEVHEASFRTNNPSERNFTRNKMRALVARTFAKNAIQIEHPDSYYEKYIKRDLDFKGRFWRFGDHGKKNYFKTEQMPDAPDEEAVKKELINQLRIKFDKRNFDKRLGLLAGDDELIE